MTRTTSTASLAAAMVAALVLATGPSIGQSRHADADSQATMCHQMMVDHHAMQEKMAAAETKLDALLAELDAAKGDARLDALAGLVRGLVTDHKDMHHHLSEMAPRMMQHMAGHMKEGATMEGGRGAMAECPMMKAMDQSEPSEGSGDHAAHHPGR